MAATGFKGIDVRQTANGLIFRASLKNSSGAILATGTTELRLFEVQDDGSLHVFDFYASTLDFTSGTPSDDEAEMTKQTHLDDGGNPRETGIWTYKLADVSKFVKGAVYIAQVTNSGASPVDQEREFQFGSIEGDDESVPANIKTVGEVDAVYALTYSGTASGTLYKVGSYDSRDYFETADGLCSLRWYPALGSGQWKLMIGLAEWDKLGASPLGDYTQGGAPTITVAGPRLVVGYDWATDVLNAPLFTLASVWTNTKAGYLDAAITSRHASGAAVAKSPATLATADVSGNLPANVVDWKGATAPAMTGDAFARLGAPTGESVSADIAGIHAKTTNLPASPAAVGSAMTLATGAITYDKFGSSAITSGAFATDAISAASLSSSAVAKIVAGQADVYTAKVTRGRNGNTEIYLVNWFKNGAAIVTGVTDATITVMPVTTPASPLISAATLNADGLAYGYLYYSANPSTEKSAAGVMYGATLSAVIDGDTRTFPWGVVKDA